MSWEDFGRLTIATQGTNAHLFPYPLSARRLKVTGLNLELSQTGYIKIGYLKIKDLDGADVANKLIIRGAQIIEIPQWASLVKIEFKPVRWIINAEITFQKWLALPDPINPLEPADPNDRDLYQKLLDLEAKIDAI
jgi:hypothetical protein